MKLIVALLGLLTCAIPQLGLAQTDTAYISGEVTDTTGAVVPNVQVGVTNVNTGVTRKAESNEAGIYVAANLPPGEYQITAEKSGFKSLVRKGIVLQVDQKSRQDLRLALGSTAESIEVTAQAEQFLNPASSALGDVTTQAESR